MSKFIDLTGQRFGKLTVINRTEDYISPNGVRAVRWNCKCDCGNAIRAKTNDLRRGKTTSCGCGKIDDLISESVGEKYGELTCLEYSHTEHGIGHFSNSNATAERLKLLTLQGLEMGI